MSTEDLWKLMEPPRKVRPTQQVAESLAKCLGRCLQYDLPEDIWSLICTYLPLRTVGIFSLASTNWARIAWKYVEYAMPPNKSECVERVMTRLLNNSFFLRDLYLTSAHVEFYPQLSKFQRLRCFATSEICGCSLSVALGALKSVRTLTTMKLWKLKLDGSFQAEFPPTLTNLIIYSCKIGCDLLASISRCTKLQDLTISSTECGLKPLRNLAPTLRRLSLANVPQDDPPVGFKTLETISMLTNLESLDLPEMESETAEYLSELSLMTKLTHFGMQLDGGGSGTAFIAELVNLRSLRLAESRRPSALRYIKGLTNLQHLDARECSLSNGDMVHLQGLPLVELDLRDNPIGNVGLIELLSLTKLESLRIGLTRHSIGPYSNSQTHIITEQAASYFANSMPHLEEFVWSVQSDL